jgi:hypothetical protein
MQREGWSPLSEEQYFTPHKDSNKAETIWPAVDKVSTTMATNVRLNDTFLRLLAENCRLKLIISKGREHQQKIIIKYFLTFSEFNDNPKRHARMFLEEEVTNHGISKRTLLRMLPRHLKDQTKMMNRLGKGRKNPVEKSPSDSAAACYVEPD